MKIASWTISVAALAVALPTKQNLTHNQLDTRQDSQNVITDDNPRIVIPDVKPGTVLATDPLSGYKAWISNGLASVIEGGAWLAETLAVVRGDRDESRGGSPASGNGS